MVQINCTERSFFARIQKLFMYNTVFDLSYGTLQVSTTHLSSFAKRFETDSVALSKADCHHLM